MAEISPLFSLQIPFLSVKKICRSGDIFPIISQINPSAESRRGIPVRPLLRRASICETRIRPYARPTYAHMRGTHTPICETRIRPYARHTYAHMRGTHTPICEARIRPYARHTYAHMRDTHTSICGTNIRPYAGQTYGHMRGKISRKSMKKNQQNTLTGSSGAVKLLFSGIYLCKIRGTEDDGIRKRIAETSD